MMDEPKLPPLPEPQGEMPYAPLNTRLWYKVPAWSREQLTDYATQAVLLERERWTAGAKISIPTDTMEQEFQAHYRRGQLAERERSASICERMALRHDDIRRAALEVAAENIRNP